MSSYDETADREQLLDEIIVRILEAREAGKEQSQAEILARYPDFEKELREFFESECIFPPDFPPLDTHPPSFGPDYEIVEEIGRGGMGIVYRAHQRSLNKTVAIKTIIEGRLASDSAVERIRREARRAAKLRHPPYRDGSPSY